MELKESFIGFTFGNRHSSKLGIVRTTSEKFETKLSPVTTDKTISVDGADGVLYCGSTYSKQEMTIPFAFYGLTDMQLQQMRRTFNDKQIHPLILDEEPYKVWSAKLTGVSTIKHLCFDNGQVRYYHGEGTFVFTMYYPFARSRYPYIEDYNGISVPEWSEDQYGQDEWEIPDTIYPAIFSIADSDEQSDALVVGLEEDLDDWFDSGLLEETDKKVYENDNKITSYQRYFTNELDVFKNLEEWKSSSGLPSNAEYGQYISDGYYLLYNAGDVPMQFKLYVRFNQTQQSFTLKCGDSNLKLKDVVPKKGDYYLLIDSGRNLIIGCDANYKETNNIYNHTIVEGDFFTLPVGEISLQAPKGRLDFNYLYI